MDLSWTELRWFEKRTLRSEGQARHPRSFKLRDECINYYLFEKVDAVALLFLQLGGSFALGCPVAIIRINQAATC
jgi:hypothetical protein